MLQLQAPKETSKEAAAAAAAGTVLAGLLPVAAEELKTALAAYLAIMPNELGQDGWRRVVNGGGGKNPCRACQGRIGCPRFLLADDTTRRLHSTAPTASPMWPNVTPFAMTSPSQFRP